MSQEILKHLDLKQIKRVVVKIGSNVLTEDQGLRKSFFKDLAKQVAYLKSKNIEVLLVSSGAIAAAMTVFKEKTKPLSIPDKQAYAAIGQPILMNAYSQEFKKQGLQVAQVLLTQEGLDHRERYLNAKHALNALFKKNVIPIVNENDTVTVEEIKIGDNDQLSAYVSVLVDADLLIIMSHVEGLYDGAPHLKKSKLIPVVPKINKDIQSLVFDGRSERTTGGMTTKLIAARYAVKAGIPLIIMSGFLKNGLSALFKNEPQGTLFVPNAKQQGARKHWISAIRRVSGKLIVDAGAQKALQNSGKSLLPSGVVSCEGRFQVGDCVSIVTKSGVVIGRGLTSYSYEDVNVILGCKSSDIIKRLGYKSMDEVLHRDNMVMDENGSDDE